jgi:transcriptional regulator with XRE-family HTH domain
MSVDLNQLKSLRKQHSYSLSYVSSYLGFTCHQAYYYKEKGSRQISAEEISKLATLYNVPIETLYTINNKPNEPNVSRLPRETKERYV